MATDSLAAANETFHDLFYIYDSATAPRYIVQLVERRMFGFYSTHIGGELIFELVDLIQAANKFFHSTPQTSQMCFGLWRTVVSQEQ